MVFSSLTFLFLFLPLVIICYYIVPKKIKNYILLCFSLFFYFYGGPKYLIIMLASILINYIFGIVVDKLSYNEKVRRIILCLSIICNILILVYYKYTDFLITNINQVVGTSFNLQQIIMPIGISFYTFQAMSYVIDIYRGEGKAQYNPFNVALYISLFPQLIAGPIVRYETVSEQIEYREETIDDFVIGIERFIFGLGKKVILANSLGVIADITFAINPKEISVLAAWIGASTYSAQIYFDFSGYSDMAIGLGRMFGFQFLENFNYPYISKSITEFWRRWHISLGSWFRDYIYIPLGGNKCGVFKHLINLFTVWLLTGLWHGASWTFVAWGLYFGIILVMEKYFLLNILKKLPSFYQHIYSLILVIIGWILFRAESFTYAFEYIKTMFFINGAPIFDKYSTYLILEYKLEYIIMIIAAIPTAKYIKNKLGERYVLKHIFLMIVFILSVMLLVKSSFNPFIYFRF